MLPTDAAMEHGSNCNTIQNALQKVGVHISFDQAAIVLIELKRELPELFRLRRKDKKESGKTDKQQTQARDEMPQSCTECWVIDCQFDYNGVGCRSQVGVARSSVA